MSTLKSGFPALQPAFVMKVDVGEGNPVGDIYTGSSFIHYNTPTGTLKTVEGFEPKIDAKVVFGGDWLYFDPDKQRARVNLKGVAKTDDGASINFFYSGIANINEPIQAIFAGSPEAKTIPFGQSTTIHGFECGHPKYKFLENHSWVGNGRFVVGDGTLTVESRVSQVVPSKDMD
ncbi:hypothetical protein FQN57_006811 [Myotisia sp. PD_48]|nr:hypothetical protein FQN57_006811 [Myotisia sp. PD_48]